MFIKIFVEELSDMWLSKYILGVEEAGETGRMSVGDLFPANKHEPLDASHGARNIAKEVGVVLLTLFKYDEFNAHLQSKAAITYKDRRNMG